MASKREQRRLATDLTGGIKGDVMSFSFPDCSRGHVLQQAWVNSLEEKIISTLEQVTIYMTLCKLLFSEGRLTWRSGLIPEQEIWVKVGGSMKTSSRFAMCLTPTTVKTFLVFFSIFETGD